MDKQQSIIVGAPGFRGLNTQDSPLSLDPTFAAKAENAVIDKFGRIGARKGRELVSTTATELGSDSIKSIFHYVDNTVANEEIVFSAGNNKVFTGTTTLVDETPSGYTITDDNWQIVEQTNHVYFFQKNHEPLVYSDDTGYIEPMSSHAGSGGTPPEANCVLAAFGRLWAADIDQDESTIYWSDTLIGAKWSGGAAGSINLSNVWPTGYDRVIAVHEHNDFLVIFGRRSTIIYSGAEDPSTMSVYDIVNNVGCVGRDTVQNIGSDLLFLSDSGVRSLGRTLQDGSAPLNDLSKNVRDDLYGVYSSESSPIKSVYSPENAFYLLSFPDNQVVYCFDLRAILENQAYRPTQWVNLKYTALHRTREGVLYLGLVGGVYTYSSYFDENETYLLRYYTHPLTFDVPERLKFLKSVKVSLIGGGTSTATLKWSYDYGDSYNSSVINFRNGSLAEYNVSEYNVGEFTSGTLFNQPKQNTTGSGASVAIGLDVVINGSAMSIQQLDIKAVLGRAD